MSGAPAVVAAAVKMSSDHARRIRENGNPELEYESKRIYALDLAKNRYSKVKKKLISAKINYDGEYEILTEDKEMRRAWYFLFLKKVEVTIRKMLYFRGVKFEIVNDIEPNQANFYEYEYHTKKNRSGIDRSKPYYFRIHLKKDQALIDHSSAK